MNVKIIVFGTEVCLHHVREFICLCVYFLNVCVCVRACLCVRALGGWGGRRGGGGRRSVGGNVVYIRPIDEQMPNKKKTFNLSSAVICLKSLRVKCFQFRAFVPEGSMCACAGLCGVIDIRSEPCVNEALTQQCAHEVAVPNRTVQG